MTILLDTVIPTASLQGAGETARRAEELGFGGIWTAEAMQTPYLPLGAAALTTEKLTLGTAITVAFPRSPMVHAMTAWELHRESKGRFILGLGTQIRKHNERRFSVEFDHPGPRLKDMILAIRHIWGAFDGDHKLSYQGEFYTHDYIQPFFNPGATGYGKPKIYIAAVGPYMCRVAGEVCDGIHIHPFHTIDYVEQVVKPNVEEGLARAGRDPSTFDYATTTFVLPGDAASQERAEGLVRTQVAFYGSTPAYKGVFERSGYHELQPKLQALMRQGNMGAMMDLIPDEMIDLVSVRAPWDGLADALRAKYAGVAARIGFYTPIIGSPDEEKWAPVVKEFAA